MWFQVRQHLKVHGIHFNEEWENDVTGATFTIEASEEEFAEVEAYAKEVQW